MIMIKVTILIPFPVSISTCFSINWLLLSFLVFIWISSKFVPVFLKSIRQHTKHHYTDSDTNTEISSQDTHLLQHQLEEKELELEEERSVFLPDELWAEVLCRLPPKHLVACKSVSNSWNSLISQVCIPKITTPLHGLIVLKGRPPHGPPYSWDFTYTTDGSHWKTDPSFADSVSFPSLEVKLFLDCSNGFLLLRQGPLLCVFNPSTQRSLLLPQGPGGYLPRAASLIFDPPFRVAYILRNPIRIVVFSSATAKWVEHRNIHVDDGLGDAWNLRYQYLQGSVYSLTSSCHLLKIDIKRPRITGIKLPEVVKKKKDEDFAGSIGLSKNRLHYGWTSPETNRLMVWTLDASRWVLKYSIPLLDFAKDLLPGVLNDTFKLTTYAFHPTSDDLFVGNTVSIFRYHPNSKKLESIYKVPNGNCIASGEVLVRVFSQNLTILKL